MKTVLLVGAGLTSATIAAHLQKNSNSFKCICVDIRSHIAGNCYDYKSKGTFISKYGPHLWHSANDIENNFVRYYSNFIPYTHKVSAELCSGMRLPFPYSKETEEKLGKKLSEQEVVDLFFRPYTKKMWNMEWDDVPNLIKGRVSKNTNEKSLYFPNQFCGVPECGYTEMMYKMFDKTEMILGQEPNDWQNIPADIIIYCGRIDKILNKKTGLTLGETFGKWLEYRNVKFSFVEEKWDDDASVVNFCHMNTMYTRKTCYRKIFNGDSNLVSYELPYAAPNCDLNPYYPIPTSKNYEIHNFLKEQVRLMFPNIILAGRTSQYVYIDMNTCVAKGLSVANDILKNKVCF